MYCHSENGIELLEKESSKILQNPQILPKLPVIDDNQHQNSKSLSVQRYNDEGIHNGDLSICSSNVIYLLFIHMVIIHTQKMLIFSSHNCKILIYLTLYFLKKLNVINLKKKFDGMFKMVF